ncbi:rhodanese-like domain-containing protein [Bacillus glycinifermentans]|uniref:rhodanese-like domain-containing protein n=1 Tax=Bacillus glycinifermentans TaxID=1664069 RepID=UPI001FF64B59|nr:hypothetical protein [Bacillus glycinifermentans]UOY90057.1 hypothetical protein MW696_07560 [Bacillus glycinifermentans]
MIIARGDTAGFTVVARLLRKKGSIEGAKHIMLGTIPDRIHDIPANRPTIVQCGSGVRSAIGAKSYIT